MPSARRARAAGAGAAGAGWPVCGSAARELLCEPGASHPGAAAGGARTVRLPRPRHARVETASPSRSGFSRPLRGMTQLPLVQLIEDGGAPFDLVLAGEARTCVPNSSRRRACRRSPAAQAIGPAEVTSMLARHPDGTLGVPSTLVTDAHAAGLLVNPWTFRLENEFLPLDYRRGAAPAACGVTPEERAARFTCAGIDGFFTDQADVGVSARAALLVPEGALRPAPPRAAAEKNQRPRRSRATLVRLDFCQGLSAPDSERPALRQR